MATIRKIKRSKGEAYQLDYYDHSGTRKRKTLYTDRRTAERICKEVEVDIELVKIGLKDAPLKSRQLRQFISDYLIYRESNNARSTVIRDKFSLNRFSNFAGNLTLSQVNAKLIDDYALSMRKNLSEATVGIELRHLKAAFNTALRWGFIIKNPFIGIKIPDGIPQKIRVLSKDEISKLLSVVSDREMKDIIKVFLATGARRSELLRPKFKWENVDYKNNKVRFEGKGGKIRFVPMTPEVREILKKHQANNQEHPFKYGQDHVSHKLRDYYRLAGIKNATLHTLRKTFGSLLLQEGHADIYIISKLLGHSSLKVTERHYIHLFDENYQACILGLSETLKSL